jgi:hypothetical protein
VRGDAGVVSTRSIRRLINDMIRRRVFDDDDTLDAIYSENESSPGFESKVPSKLWQRFGGFVGRRRRHKGRGGDPRKWTVGGVNYDTNGINASGGDGGGGNGNVINGGSDAAAGDDSGVNGGVAASRRPWTYRSGFWWKRRRRYSQHAHWAPASGSGRRRARRR